MHYLTYAYLVTNTCTYFIFFITFATKNTAELKFPIGLIKPVICHFDLFVNNSITNKTGFLRLTIIATKCQPQN